MTVDTETSTAQEPQGDVQETPEQPQGEQTATTETTDQESDELASWKAASRKHEDRWKALAAENDDLKKQLESANDAAGRVTDLEAAVSAAEKRAERAEVAAEVASVKGVKLRYLTGETREELEASADEVLSDFKAMAKVGVVPTQGTGDPAPRVTSYASGAERARAQAEKTK